jgi:hypothetical protein
MCKEMPVIPDNSVVDKKRIIGKNGGAKEEERHKGSLTQKNGRVRATSQTFKTIFFRGSST